MFKNYSVEEIFVLYFIYRVRNKTILSRKTYNIAVNVLEKNGIDVDKALEDIDFEEFENMYYEVPMSKRL